MIVMIVVVMMQAKFSLSIDAVQCASCYGDDCNDCDDCQPPPWPPSSRRPPPRWWPCPPICRPGPPLQPSRQDPHCLLTGTKK